MKPTQQDLIRLARLAGFHVGDQFVAGASEDDLERFATLLLERFGAGGGGWRMRRSSVMAGSTRMEIAVQKQSEN